jgi:hypothetical protein
MRQPQRVLKNLLQEPFANSELIVPLIPASDVWGGGQEMNSQHYSYRWLGLDSQLLAGPTNSEQGFKLFCDWGRQITIFVFTADTEISYTKTITIRSLFLLFTDLIANGYSQVTIQKSNKKI